MSDEHKDLAREYYDFNGQEVLDAIAPMRPGAWRLIFEMAFRWLDNKRKKNAERWKRDFAIMALALLQDDIERAKFVAREISIGFDRNGEPIVMDDNNHEHCETCGFGNNCPIRRYVNKLDSSLPPPVTREKFGCSFYSGGHRIMAVARG